MSSARAIEPYQKRHLWRWGLLLAILLLIGAVQLWRSVLQSQIRREIAELHREGYPVTVAELQKWLPVLPDQENSALRVLEAADYLAIAPNAFSRDKWPARGEEYGPAERDALQQMISDNAPALEVVHAAAKLERSRFPVDYNRGPNTLLPHLAQVKSLSQLLRSEAFLHSEEGRPDAAIQSILAGLALARTLDSEPLLISQLVRVACLATSCSGLERVLTQHSLSEAQLSTLAQAFRGAREASDAAFQRGYVGELCIGVYCFKASPAELSGSLGSDSEAIIISRFLYPLYAWSGLRDRDQRFYLRTMHNILNAAKAPFPQKLLRTKEVDQQSEQGLKSTKLLIFSNMLLPSLQRSIEKAAESEARMRCLEAALAVERYRVKHKAGVPNDLSELPADIARAMAMDPVDGTPLRYRKLNPGYVVYSLGPDQSDDGGVEKSTGTGVRKWPPTSLPEEESRNSRGSSGRGKGHDITFTVER